MYSNDISDLHILERLSLDLVEAIRVLGKHEHGVRSRGALDKAYLAVREDEYAKTARQRVEATT